MNRKRNQKNKPRNWVVPLMREHCKPGNHGDKRKDERRKACRRHVKDDE